MRKDEKEEALRALAKQYPTKGSGPFGVWTNPLKPGSRGIRWTGADFAMFEQFQEEQGHVSASLWSWSFFSKSKTLSNANAKPEKKSHLRKTHKRRR